MSNSKMLIDASHPEETRVVVLKGNRVEEFDFESASRKQLRGNIYLAKVTRVEPSLQAAFVEYGGNRHGFLAFSEIHPDYYQIPFADRQALLEEEARAHRDEEDDIRGGDTRGGDTRSGGDTRGGSGSGDTKESRNGGGERGEARGGRGERNDRGGRGDRSERGDRNQRRSRRHRRDAPAPMDRRGPADDSVSEPVDDAIESDAGVALLGVDVAGAVTVADETGLETSREATAGLTDRPEALDAGDDTPSVAADSATDGSSPLAQETPEHHEETAISEAPVAPQAEPASASQELAAETAGHEPSAHDQPVMTPAEDLSATPDASVVGEAYPAPADHHADSASSEELGAVASMAPEPSHEAPASSVDHEDEDDDGHAPIESHDLHHPNDHHDDDAHASEDEHVEQIGGDALSDVAPRPVRLRRHYKIQEVIKRRQILLIQVVKEERGNKGAALTTYLSLAGRYSVLMPNTAKGGGISRKITDGEDRKRLKAIAQELDVPEGMGVILRTAGAARSPIEVRRDFEYLLRMWESVRELTLKSTAPTLVYEEGSLIKRSIRDLFGKEVEEIVVAGDAGFAEARDFMRMLMPGNVKSVVPYRDPAPIFAKAGVEAQLDAMFSAHVTLKSGGYLVINQTEALVAIDVNSGRSTREHNIEDTALRTNMEAADEVARQLRLRDLAGLIVVDFIDMEEGRNNRAVERRIKEALKNDRARIQIGRISHFGLLEMSRQRIRTGVLEGSTIACPHCAGAGTVRSTASIALHVLRLVEDVLIKDASHDLIVRSRAEVALYVLNQKRAKLVELEQRFGVTIMVTADPTLTGMIYHAIERGELATPAIAPAPRQDLVRVDSIGPIYEAGTEFEEETVEPIEEAEGEADFAAAANGEETSADGGEGRRRKRRRRRRGRDREGSSDISADAPQPSDDGLATMAAIGGDLLPEPQMDVDAPSSQAPDAPEIERTDVQGGPADEPPAGVTASIVAESAEPVPEEAEEAPRRRRSRRAAAPVEKVVEGAEGLDEAPARPRRRRPSRARTAGTETETVLAAKVVDGDAQSVAQAVTTGAANGTEPVAESDAAVAPEAGAEPVVQAFSSPDVAAAASGGLMAESGPSPAEAPAEEDAESAPSAPKRSGWWQRAKASFGT